MGHWNCILHQPFLSASFLMEPHAHYTCKRKPNHRWDRPDHVEKLLYSLSVSLETRIEAMLLITVFYITCYMHLFRIHPSIKKDFLVCLQGTQTLCVYCDNTMRVVSLCNNDFLFQHYNWFEVNTYFLGKCMNCKIYFKGLHCCHGC